MYVACKCISFCAVYVSKIHYVRLRWLSGHLLGKSRSLGEPYVLIVLCLFVNHLSSFFGFEVGVLVTLQPDYAQVLNLQNNYM